MESSPAALAMHTAAMEVTETHYTATCLLTPWQQHSDCELGSHLTRPQLPCARRLRVNSRSPLLPSKSQNKYIEQINGWEPTTARHQLLPPAAVAEDTCKARPGRGDPIVALYGCSCEVTLAQYKASTSHSFKAKEHV